MKTNMKEKKKEKEKKKVQNGWLNKMDRVPGWLFGWESHPTVTVTGRRLCECCSLIIFIFSLTPRHATHTYLHVIYILVMFVFLFFSSRFLNAA